jgi:ABC-2 type transport system ATP-binding protein
MTQAQIVVHDLSKTYRVPEREPGLVASLKSMVRRVYRDVEAVRDVSFTVEPGEMVGFIGPNGAGKTSTLKMLSGLLHPTAGEARVLGFVPWARQADYLRRISMVLGNKSQMLWDIPPLDTFHVLGEIYHVPSAELKRTLDELIELLDMQELLTKPVRNFSLGERMKCELVAGLLHQPQVLFLDEPTLGLPRRDDDSHQPLHGRRRGAVSAGDPHPPRTAAVRRRVERVGGTAGAVQAGPRGFAQRSPRE